MTEKPEDDKIEQIKEKLPLADDTDDDWLLRGPPPLDRDEWIKADEHLKEQHNAIDNATE